MNTFGERSYSLAFFKSQDYLKMNNLLQDPTILRSRNKSSGHMGKEFYEPHCRSERHCEQKSLDTAGSRTQITRSSRPKPQPYAD